MADLIRRSKAAEALRAEGEAEAAKVRDVGLAQAETIRARGEAEAESRRQLAEALRAYSEAGISLEALKVLPDVIAAASEPLSRAGSTTIISNGSGGGTGASKLTADVTEVLTSTLPVVKSLSGIDLLTVLRGALGQDFDDELSASSDQPQDGARTDRGRSGNGRAASGGAAGGDAADDDDGRDARDGTSTD